ncbi:MAG: hypothetical protein SFU85_09220 [Candidatus Methylacidiphilales bacterium]|nr:hypothetical protein [Candidatus Methylacidiphilales bacterium]
MNKILLLLTGIAFVSLSTVQAGGSGCSGCGDKDKKEETKKEDGKKS